MPALWKRVDDGVGLGVQRQYGPRGILRQSDDGSSRNLSKTDNQHWWLGPGRILGKALTRSKALASPLVQEFFAVADHIAHNDPAVKSYLSGEQVSSEGRKATVN